MRYVIVGIYKGDKEVIDETNSIKDAIYLVNEYRLAFGNDWRIYYVAKKGVRR